MVGVSSWPGEPHLSVDANLLSQEGVWGRAPGIFVSSLLAGYGRGLLSSAKPGRQAGLEPEAVLLCVLRAGCVCAHVCHMCATALVRRLVLATRTGVPGMNSGCLSILLAS